MINWSRAGGRVLLYFKNNHKARWFELNLCGYYCANSMGHDGVVDEKL